MCGVGYGKLFAWSKKIINSNHLSDIKLLQRDMDNWRNVSKYRSSYGGSSYGNESRIPVKMASLDKLQLGKVYNGKVNAVVNNKQVVKLYCKFGEGGEYFEKDGFVKSILFSAFHGRPFQKGDDVKVICKSAHPLELFLLPEYVRPLLILDINGVLGERTGFDPKNPTSARGFRHRRHHREFIEMCSQYFELAVWSCSRRNNMELSIFSGIHLNFIWGQEESTSLYPRTSVVSVAKVEILILFAPL